MRWSILIVTCTLAACGGQDTGAVHSAIPAQSSALRPPPGEGDAPVPHEIHCEVFGIECFSNATFNPGTTQQIEFCGGGGTRFDAEEDALRIAYDFMTCRCELQNSSCLQ